MCHSEEKKEEAQRMKPSLQASVSLVAEVVTAGCSSCFQCLGYHFCTLEIMISSRAKEEIQK